jgi:hypothetical protein
MKRILLSLLILSSSAAWAATLNCPTVSGTTSATVNNGTNGFGGGTTVSQGGCFAVDETFGNFGLSGAAISSGTLDTIMSANAAPVGQSVDLNGTFSVAASSSAVSTVTYVTQFGTSFPATNSLIQQIVITLSGVNIPVATSSNSSGDSSIQLAIGVCENPANDDGAPEHGGISSFTGTTCTGTTAGDLVGTGYVSNTFTITNTSQITPISNGTFSFGIELSEPVSVLALDNLLTLTSVNGASGITFSDFTESFDSPEPATFVLLGSALLVIALLRYRRVQKLKESRS